MLNMISIVKKVKGILRRLKRAFNITLQPDNYYIYPRNVYGFHKLSFSQEGEDMVLARIFEGQLSGFFVDIGAHHPQKYSNTYYFYLQGWQGINIDAKPGSMNLFNKLRPRDLNIEKAISDVRTELDYYEFNEPALNGFREDLSKERDGIRNYKIISTIKLYTYTLTEILEKYLLDDQIIDFLSIDVEGLDMQVLKSNDWTKYRPKVVLVEDLNLSSLNGEHNSEVIEYLNTNGYYLYSKTVFTLFFKRIEI